MGHKEDSGPVFGPAYVGWYLLIDQHGVMKETKAKSAFLAAQQVGLSLDEVKEVRTTKCPLCSHLLDMKHAEKLITKKAAQKRFTEPLMGSATRKKGRRIKHSHVEKECYESPSTLPR